MTERIRKIDQLTEALNYKGYELKRSSVISTCFQEIIEHWRERDTYTKHLWNLTNSKIPNIYLIFLQSLHDPALDLWRKLL